MTSVEPAAFLRHENALRLLDDRDVVIGLTGLEQGAVLASADAGGEAQLACPHIGDLALRVELANVLLDLRERLHLRLHGLDAVVGRPGSAEPAANTAEIADASAVRAEVRTSADATVVLDFNPFLLLLAREITRAGAVSLYELPRAPKSLDDCAVLRSLEAPATRIRGYILS